MRNSKILKGICYITIPILFLCFVISVLYQIEKDNYSNVVEDDCKEYFESSSFLANYMNILSNNANNLIYRNDRYNSIEDGEYKICYTNSKSDYGYYYDAENNIVDNYFLILYKNLALTNVELTTNTNSIDKIKTYIASCNGKKTKIINGNIESDSEIISTKGLQYFESFKNTYYKTVENDKSNIQNIEVSEDLEFTNENTRSN